MELKTTPAKELIDAQARGTAPDIIDVRSPGEFETMHARDARSFPLTTLDAASLAAEHSGRPEPLYVICQTGGRAKKACERLASAGLGSIVLVEGGMVAWERAGGPVVRGKGVISLERQIRIAAGALVVIGVVLAVLVSQWFLLLSAFVGGGLMFSGITDTCGMGMLLARMPWNTAPRACTQPGQG